MEYLIYILKPIYKILEFFIKLLLRYQSAIFAIFGVILGCAGLWCAQLGGRTRYGNSQASQASLQANKQAYGSSKPSWGSQLGLLA